MAKKERTPEEAKLLRRSFWRSWLAMASTNIAKQNAHAYLVAVQPWLDHLYGHDREELGKTMSRNNEFYNTNYTTSCFIIGLGIAMEKERARTLETDTPMDGRIISNMKVSLQGPLAGIGDTIMFNTVRVIAAGIAMPFCAEANILGPIIFFSIQAGVQFFLRYNLFYLGYDVGLPFIEKVVSGGLIDATTNAAAILGLTMIGAMVSTMVRVPIRWRIEMGEVTLVVQEVLDMIMPNMLPLLMFFLTVHLLRKKIKAAQIILIYMAACVVLGLLRIM
jgi:mannose/fructose/N-acetylgalactosamine-specific phosphotransferase system component IID